MTITLATRPTIVDRVLPRSLATDIALIALGAAATAVSAQLVIPASPVPFTFQTMAVLLVGATLGSVRGALSMLLYLAVGILGVPVFSDARHGIEVVFGATGGFLLGFVAAAAVIGALAERKWSSHVVKMFASYVISTAIVYAFGIPVLGAVAFSGDLSAAAILMSNYLIWDALKAIAAALILPIAWKGVQAIRR